ncbi:MAG: hypothetical protein MUE44_28660 [Oscillatoriaceae cyanobacterium Prado104]|nr:hypothetical protein [Oscillatoriaceae cyanobacterium Prado104]
MRPLLRGRFVGDAGLNRSRIALTAGPESLREITESKSAEDARPDRIDKHLPLRSLTILLI